MFAGKAHFWFTECDFIILEHKKQRLHVNEHIYVQSWIQDVTVTKEVVLVRDILYDEDYVTTHNYPLNENSLAPVW